MFPSGKAPLLLLQASLFFPTETVELCAPSWRFCPLALGFVSCVALLCVWVLFGGRRRDNGGLRGKHGTAWSGVASEAARCVGSTGGSWAHSPSLRP